MEGRKIVFSDGTEIADGECGFSNGVLWCYNVGTNFLQVATQFSDPAKTASITFVYGEMQDVYEGYTDVIAVMTQFDGTLKVALRKGANE